jgi:uncharacterized protein (TIGR03435 family)
MLADTLAEMTGRPVSDATGLPASYDFRIDFASDDSATDLAPSINSAIQEQLKLRLEPARGQVERLVIDRAEKPTQN